jgi:hypothetical protein
MITSRVMVRTIAIAFTVVFLVSFLTVETYQSHGYSWLRYPGFLESNAEIAVAGTGCEPMEGSGVAQYCAFPYRDPFAGQATLFLHICRGPPLIGSEIG